MKLSAAQLLVFGLLLLGFSFFFFFLLANPHAWRYLRRLQLLEECKNRECSFRTSASPIPFMRNNVLAEEMNLKRKNRMHADDVRYKVTLTSNIWEAIDPLRQCIYEEIVISTISYDQKFRKLVHHIIYKLKSLYSYHQSKGRLRSCNQNVNFGRVYHLLPWEPVLDLPPASLLVLSSSSCSSLDYHCPWIPSFSYWPASRAVPLLSCIEWQILTRL